MGLCVWAEGEFPVSSYVQDVWCTTRAMLWQEAAGMVGSQADASTEGECRTSRCVERSGAVDQTRLEMDGRRMEEHEEKEG